MPYDQSLGALLHDPGFQNLLPGAVFQKARVIQKVGNQAVHSGRPIRQYDALQVVKELHHLCHWLVRTYKPAAAAQETAWSDQRVPKAPAAGEVVPRNELEALEKKLAELQDNRDHSALEAAFVSYAAAYSERKGISYAAWREAGVSPTVLTKAGIRRR